MMELPKRGGPRPESRYATLGLRDLPFPSEPVVNPYSGDPRRNGAIYAESPVQAEIAKFEELLIDPGDFENRASLAYLWAKGDQQSGRGVGKTALLRYFRQRINKDWGKSESNASFSALVVYVSFQSQVDRRHMQQLALSGLVDICKIGVLDASRAALRLEELSDEEGAAVMADESGGLDPKRLLDDGVLGRCGVDADAINKAVADKLVTAGVESNVATQLAAGTFEQYLRSFRRDHQLEPLYVPRDTLILDYAAKLLFDDMVLYLRAAGFRGGYLFIDDIENLVDRMPRRARLVFAKEFGLCTVRPGYANAAYRFFSCVLTTHQQASVGLAAAWGEAGLSAIARLDPESPNSVELPLPNRGEARDILIAHLDYYRIDQSQMGSIAPFTADGIEAVLRKQENPHPRQMLADACRVVIRAASDGVTSIDAHIVNEALADTSVIAVPDLSEGIESAL
jgi:hypothetical protein